MHDLLDTHQPLANFAAWVQIGEVLFLESFGHKQGHRERVAKRQRRRCARGRHKIKGARLAGYLAVQRDIRRLRQLGRGVAADCDQTSAQSLDRLDEAEFIRLAAIRQRQTTSSR